MVETLTLLLDPCAGKSWSPPFPHPQLFNPLENFQIKQTNTTAFCLETLLAQNLFLSNWAGEREKRHSRSSSVQARRGSGRNARLCGSLAPSQPCWWCPGALSVRASATAATQPRTFLCEAAVPHHAKAVTKRRRYYGKDFSASYSRVRDSASGRSRLLTGN